jgi:dsDNA-specific endonuclease/ATPase MutS2
MAEDTEDDAIALPIEDSIDLHPFAPKDIPDVVEEYLNGARAAGFREVRLIHGRGRGFQRSRIHALLQRLPFVQGASEAPPDRGGWGATIVVLRPLEDDPSETS